MAGGPAPASVVRIPVNAIEPNPHNPRRLFDEEPMAILKESIAKLGLLVPVTVYRTGEVGGYVLLDGERRWRCVRELGQDSIPAIIVEEPKEAENILTMFHIHNVREGWQLMPTALKLHTLMDVLKETNERKLAELTKLSLSQIRRCRILLSYPKRFQNLMLAPPSERMKADFFIELDRVRRPARAERWEVWTRHGDVQCIDVFLSKYEARVIRAVTEVRKLAEVYRASVRLHKRKAFERALGGFLDDPTLGIDDVRVAGATFAKEVKEVGRSARRLLTQVRALPGEGLAADQATSRLLLKLARMIEAKLRGALLIGPRDDAS